MGVEESVTQVRTVETPHQRFRPITTQPAVSGGVIIRGTILFVTLTALYLVNGRYVGSGDCVPAMYLPIALARGDGPWLDRFEAFLSGPDGRLPGYCEKSRGHVVSRYPMGPGLVLAPLVVPQVWANDRLAPGWDADADSTRAGARRMAKNASAVLAAATMVLLWVFLRSLFREDAAIFATIAAALGTGMWSTASQAPWQHGPAVFCLVAVLCLLRYGKESAGYGALAGFFTAMIVVCRTVDLPIAAAVSLFMLRLRPGVRHGFAASATVVAVLWGAWHVYFFDHLNGGYAEIEKMHGWAHGIKGSWSTPLFAGLAGTFLSPSHGLVTYSPWVLTCLAAPFGLRTLSDPKHRSLVSWLGLSLVPSSIMLAKYGCWWAGHCFGPRFWIDSTPIFAIFAAAAWQWLDFGPNGVRRTAQAILILTVVWSAALQAVAVATYPTTWHSKPTNADRDHSRLWDFRDNEVTRGLKEGPQPREWQGLF